VSRLSAPFPGHLLDLREGQREAVIALDGRGIVCVARFLRDAEDADTAEVAVLVGSGTLGRAVQGSSGSASRQQGVITSAPSRPAGPGDPRPARIATSASRGATGDLTTRLLSKMVRTAWLFDEREGVAQVRR
jgi:hypothetical protein